MPRASGPGVSDLQRRQNIEYANTARLSIVAPDALLLDDGR
jgi:hypothetical protein